MDAKLNETMALLQATQKNLDMFFLVVNGIIVYLMQCGFAFLECGAVRAKNATNILLKNILDSFIGAISYWIIGYAFAFGEGNFFIGAWNFVQHDLPPEEYAFWFYQFVFAATAVTIVSGAVAERCEFAAYLIYSVALTGFVYPVVSHWAWADEGWLKVGYTFEFNNKTEQVTYQDFAGSGVVHVLGGICALVGAAVLGPRKNRFDADKDPKEFTGHSVPLVALGGFILFFGFFAFNGGSQLSISSPDDGAAVAKSVVNTIMSAAFSGMITMIAHRVSCRIRGIKPTWSLLVTVNGGISGMVAICASCDSVHAWGAAVIGAVAGLNYLLWSYLVLKCGVDDPLDAGAVHAGSGIWGVMAAPILSLETGLVFRWDKRAGMAIAWNLAGVTAIVLWSLILCLILFFALRFFKILRVKPEYEDRGIDIPKHGEPAYPMWTYGDGWPSHPSLDKLSEMMNYEGVHRRRSSTAPPYVTEEECNGQVPFTRTKL